VSTTSFYAGDLAYIHHAGFGDFARSAAPGLLRLLKQTGIRGGTLVDLACGSGIWAAIAARHGFHVVGVDQSAAMLKLARRVAPGVEFHHASLHRFELPQCDAVTVMGEGLNYLSPGERPGRRLARLFPRIARAIRPGGLLLFDVMVREGEPMGYRSWREGPDWAVLFEVEERPREKLLTRRQITFRKAGRFWRRGDETHRVQLFTRAEVLRALRRAGFAVRTVRRYGNYRLLPRRLGFVARRKR
jgi:SAM-dependent methyltransferase